METKELSAVMWQTLYTLYRGTGILTVGFEYKHHCIENKKLVGTSLVTVDPFDGVDDVINDITYALTANTIVCDALSREYGKELNIVNITFEVHMTLEDKTLTLEGFKRSYIDMTTDILEQIALEGYDLDATFCYTESMFADYLGGLCSVVLCDHFGRTSLVPMSFVWDAEEKEYRLDTEEESIRDYVMSFSGFGESMIANFVGEDTAVPLEERVAAFARECVEYATMWYKALGVNTVQEQER